MADRRKEQNKRAQQRFREKRQKELDDLRSSFDSMKDEMAALQAALEAAQRENTLLKSRVDNQAAFSSRAEPAGSADGDAQNFLRYLDDEDREFQQLFGEPLSEIRPVSPEAAALAGEPSLFVAASGSKGRPSSKDILTAGSDLLPVENSRQEDGDGGESGDGGGGGISIGLQRDHNASPMSSCLTHQQSQDQDHGIGDGCDTSAKSVALAMQSGIHKDGSCMAANPGLFYDSDERSSTYNIPQNFQQIDALACDPSGLWPANFAIGGEGAMMGSSDGERLMGLFSQLLALEYARISARNQLQPVYQS